MEDILFLDIEDVLKIHEIALERYGGQKGIREMNLLISAVYQPRHTFDGEFLYTSVSEMAAVYAYHLSENQPFIDGNKRTAFAASVVFLKLNGYVLQADNEAVYQLFIDLANKRIDKDGLIFWYKLKVNV
jgi:death-on-curing protein